MFHEKIGESLRGLERECSKFDATRAMELQYKEIEG